MERYAPKIARAAIANYRAAHGMKLKELAKVLGVSAGHMSSINNGKRSLPERAAIQLGLDPLPKVERQDVAAAPVAPPLHQKVKKCLEDIRQIARHIGVDRRIDELLIILEAYALPAKESYWRTEYDLTPSEAAILDLLERHFGHPVSRDAISNALYFDRPAHQDVPDVKIIDVQICRARSKLKDTPYVIETDWGRGYRLTRKAA